MKICDKCGHRMSAHIKPYNVDQKVCRVEGCTCCIPSNKRAES